MTEGGFRDFADYLECRICCHRYDTENRRPKLISCSHTFCYLCLESLSQCDVIRCPECQKETLVPPGGVEKLMSNLEIIRLLDMFCDGCKGFVSSQPCKHCSQQFCPKCLPGHLSTLATEAVANVESEAERFKRNSTRITDESLAFCSQTRSHMNQYSSDQLKLIIQKSAELSQALKRINGNMDSDFSSATIPELIQPTQDEHQRCFAGTVHEKTTENVEEKQKPIDTLPLQLSEKPTQKSSSVVPSNPVSLKNVNFQYKLLFGDKEKRFRKLLRPSGKLEKPLAVMFTDNRLHVADDTQISIFNVKGEYMNSYKVKDPLDLAITSSGDLLISLLSDKLQVVRDGRVLQELGGPGEAPGQFDSPCGVTTTRDGLMLVADFYNHRVQILNPSGGVVRIVGTDGPGKLDRPVSVAVHPTTDEIYVCGYCMKAVYIYSATGGYISSITAEHIPGISQLRPFYVSFRHDGILAISDSCNDSVHLMQGIRHLQTLGGRGSDPGEFDEPCGTTFTDTGLVVCDVKNNRVQVFEEL